MLENGKYIAWFRTPLAQGTSIVVLEDGHITGEGAVMAYSGFYEQDGNKFKAVVRTRRHSPGEPSAVFGIDEVELQLEGRSSGPIVICRGSTVQSPGLAFEATLIRSHDEEPAEQTNQQTPKPTYRRMRLPKLSIR